MPRPHIVHLIDDTTAGGVMRLLDHIQTSPEMARDARHAVHVVRRGALSMRRIKADIIVSHLTLSWRSLPALMSLRALHAGTPLIHVEHSYTQAFTALNVPNRDRFLTMLRIGYSMFDHLVAVSHDQARWMFKRGLADLGALTVIPPMVGLHGFAALTAPNGTPRRIGAIGRLDRQKGFDLLILAFKSLPDPLAQLVIYGEGPERAQLETLAKGDPRIIFAGHAETPETAMNDVDAVVMPSRWEAYGLVALEARIAGRPVLVSAKDGLKDQIQDGATAVPTFTIAGWQTALDRLLAGHSPACARPCPHQREADFAQSWRRIVARLLDDQAPLAAAA